VITHQQNSNKRQLIFSLPYQFFFSLQAKYTQILLFVVFFDSRRLLPTVADLVAIELYELGLGKGFVACTL